MLDVVRAGLDGSPRAVLVHGEAGIGKTVLVRSVCAQVAGEGAQVLWGQSLRFGAVEAMYHPLVLALESWLRRGRRCRAGLGDRGRAERGADPALAGRLARGWPVDADDGGRRTAEPGGRPGPDGAGRR